MELGKLQALEVSKIEDGKVWLANKVGDLIALMDGAGSGNLELGDRLEVFVFQDENKITVATLQKPNVQLEQFAYLEVKRVSKFGAFVDWGLPVDLYVPREEQTEPMKEGHWYLVFLFLDEKNNRLLGSCKERDFLFFDKIDVKERQEVDLLLYKQTEIGMNCIVNNLYKGLIFKSDIHKIVHPGDRCKGYVKLVREDGKLDIVLEPIGYQQSVDVNVQSILKVLHAEGGFIGLTDKSSPEDIKLKFGLSKKAFKKAIGYLYKIKQIEIYKDGIKLLKTTNQ